jgi:response regulator RpfG family c-di-GMP phosphodiesterase
MPFGVNSFSVNLILAFVLLALLFPFLSKERSELVDVVSVYRPVALSFLLLNPLLILIAPIVSNALLPVATAAIPAAMASLAFEIRSSRKLVSRRFCWVVFAFFALLTGVMETRWNFGRSIPENLGDATAFSTILITWSSFEAAAAYIEKRNRQYLLVIASGLLAAAGMFARAWILRHGAQTFDSIFFNENELLLTRAVAAAGLLAMSVALSQIYLQNEWKSEAWSRKKAEDGLLATLGALSLARDEETGQHIKRTSEFVRVLAGGLRQKGSLSNHNRYDIVDIMSRAAPLHDIGKIGIPDAILGKPGKLNQEEWEIMKTHAAIGEEVLRSASSIHENHDGYIDLLMRTGIEIAGGHHENWDGSGYPRGLSGKNIPEAARIMSVADVYDALTSVRPYKRPWSHADAVAEIRRLRGSKFDPEIVDIFIASEQEIAGLAEMYRD